jgi:hypothetical protein
MHSMFAVGGVGGSGTRVVAGFLQKIGFFLGSDLNGPKDNLWFTFLFKRPEILQTTSYEFDELVQIFSDAMHSQPVIAPEHVAMVRSLAASGREQHPVEWLQERADSLLGIVAGPSNLLIGWKEPNTHIVLDRLASHMPGLRYIHVIRNGLDMALSRNQNQTGLWGPLITGKPFDPSPSYSLHYWCKAEKRVLQIGRRMGERFHLVNFDELCTNPSKVIDGIAALAGIKLSAAMQEKLCAEVNPPASIGRFREQDLTVFDPEDVAFVASCGFPTA